MHNTGAGQIEQDLRDDIGTRTSERGNISGRARRIWQRRRGEGGQRSTESGANEREKERERNGKERGIGGEEGIEQLNRKRHNGPGWLWRRVIKWVPHSHTAA